MCEMDRNRGCIYVTTIRDVIVISPLKNQRSAVDSGSFAENEMKNVYTGEVGTLKFYLILI